MYEGPTFAFSPDANLLDFARGILLKRFESIAFIRLLWEVNVFKSPFEPKEDAALAAVKIMRGLQTVDLVLTHIDCEEFCEPKHETCLMLEKLSMRSGKDGEKSGREEDGARRLRIFAPRWEYLGEHVDLLAKRHMDLAENSKPIVKAWCDLWASKW